MSGQVNSTADESQRQKGKGAVTGRGWAVDQTGRRCESVEASTLQEGESRPARVRRRVGPERAGHFCLRSSVLSTSARRACFAETSTACSGRSLTGRPVSEEDLGPGGWYTRG